MDEKSKRWHGATTRDHSGRRAVSLGQASYMMMADERFFEMGRWLAPLLSIHRTSHGIFFLLPRARGVSRMMSGAKAAD